MHFWYTKRKTISTIQTRKYMFTYLKDPRSELPFYIEIVFRLLRSAIIFLKTESLWIVSWFKITLDLRLMCVFIINQNNPLLVSEGFSVSSRPLLCRTITDMYIKTNTVHFVLISFVHLQSIRRCFSFIFMILSHLDILVWTKQLHIGCYHVLGQVWSSVEVAG